MNQILEQIIDDTTNNIVEGLKDIGITMYAIYHVYDVDGGLGDAVTQEELLGFLDSEEKAKKYIEKYEKLQVYDEPYQKLYCHGLRYEPMVIKNLDMDKDPWEDDDYFATYGDGLRDDEEDEEDA